MIYDKRRKATGLKISDTYIIDLTIAAELKYQHVKKRPELTLEIAAERLFWCYYRAYQKTKKWREYMWSDECSVERGKEGKIVWVQGQSTDKWKPTYIQIYKKGKGIRVMVSTAFQGNRQRSDLLILEYDFKSKKYGYSANSYLALLKDLVVPNYTDDLIFIQGNTLIHTTRKVKKWFEERGI